MKMIDNELLEEIIDKRLTQQRQEIIEQVDHKIMTYLAQAQRPQQRASGEEVVFWRQVSDILAEEAPDAPRRLMAFISQWAKDKGVPNGNEIYQHGYNIYTRH